ncbi:hypothetical protein [Streptomyces sp. NPDC005209]|uniref:hypothetical protein n=1 Tax=Streptomyces sp. NPDC005209 TaxID=3156715 RepID=UPI0033A22A1A
MSTPPRPRLKSVTAPPSGPSAAPQAVDATAVGEPKGAARKGVVTALRSNRFRPSDVRPSGDPTPERPGIRIFASPVYRDHWDGARWSKRYGATPTAACACPCGATGAATGADDVAELVRDYAAHRSACPGTPATLPGKRAAA